MADTHPTQPRRSSLLITLALLAMVPAMIVAGLLGLSPNFKSPNQSSETVLSYPLGGDFLQEYVGGGLIQDQALRKQLYDAETFNVAQHDPARIGFLWDDQQFFPAVYPPFWYAAVGSLAKLPYLTAAKIWLILMTVALIAGAWILNRFAGVPVPLLMAMCLSSPVIQSLNAGQKGTLLLLILSASYVLLKQQRHFLSGLVFALIAFKPHLAVAIGLWMVANRNWRWCAGALLGLSSLAIASVMISSDLLRDYLNVVSGFGDYVQSGGYNLHESFSLWSFWQQLVNHSLVAKVLTIMTSLSVLVVSLWMFRQRGSGASTRQDVDRAFSAMVVVTIITSPHLYTYDLTVLLLPIGLLARVAIDSKTQERDYAAWLPAGLLVVLMFANGALISFAQSVGVQVGVLLLLATWVAIMRFSFAEPARVS